MTPRTRGLLAAAAACALVSAASPAWAEPRATDDSCPAGLLPARFYDVLDDSTHTPAVDCVVHWRIGQGTGPERYSPAAPVTRGQMATFLARLVRASHSSLADGPDAFDDDDGTAHEAATNALAAAGVVSGKGDRRYDPLAAVTRDQMATFLVRAHDHASADALPGGPDAFGDDEGNTHEAAIDRAAAAGFTGGTAGRQYSPGGVVRRDQMASFLARLLDDLVQDGDAAAPVVPDLDPACSAGELEAAVCEFAHAVQGGDLSTLSAHERAVAQDVDDLPAGAWTLDVCELVGDVTARCELAFAQTSAAFYLQPANGEYDGEGGLDVPPGETWRAAVVEYAGTGPSGTFQP